MSLYGWTRPPFRLILSSSSGSSALWSLLSGMAVNCSVWPTLRTRTALESPTLAQNTFVPTIRTETQVDPLNLKFILESFVSVSYTLKKDLVSYSFTSVESTTLCIVLAWSNVDFMDCSTWKPSCVFTNSETSFPYTPWPSATAKKWVLLYSPKCGKTKYES